MKNQQGIGLLELMLSLAIIAVLLVMATRYYASANNAQRANQATSFVQAVVAATGSYSAGNTGYQGLTADNICRQGYLPKRYCVSPTAMLIGPFGSNVSITGRLNDFTLNVAGLPATVCENVGSKFSNSCSGTALAITLGS